MMNGKGNGDMNNQNTFEINNELDAKAIFMKYSGSDYQIKKALGNSYDTYKEFVCKDGNSKKWAQEICCNILGEIISGNTTDYIKNLIWSEV